MKRFSLIIIGLILVMSIFGQILQVEETEINFGQQNIDTEATMSISIQNISEQVISLDIYENSDVISTNQDNFTLNPNQEIDLAVSFLPETNIVYNHTLFLNVSEYQLSLPIQINASGRFPNPAYDTTFNKWDAELKNALYNLINNHYVISYEDARIELFGYIANESGQVRCVYTNQWYSCTPGGIPNWNSINTEHTWPQSMGAEGDARSDLHHLFPTNSQANSIRGNYPFGEVVNASWQEGGSKKGSDLAGNTVFEPRDDHKGDTARALFYFAMRYNNPSNFLNSANQQIILRDWYYQDPVSEYEVHRNTEIKEIQGKANPFIEYPILLDRIANITFDVSVPRFPIIYTPYNDYTFPETAVNTVSRIYIPLANHGQQTLNISAINSSSDIFSVVDYPNTLNIGDWAFIQVEFSPSAESAYEGSLQLFSNNDTYTITLTGNGNPTTNSTDVTDFIPLTLDNYPNPFAQSTTLSVKGSKNKTVIVEIYNVKGQKINQLEINDVKGGNGQINWEGRNRFGKKVPSGLYFAKIISDNETITKKMLIMK